MNTTLLRSSALGALIMLAACGDGPSPGVDAGSPGLDATIGDDAASPRHDTGTGIDVNGHVVDTQGANVSFALVVVAGRTTTTNATGRFHLSDVAVPYDPLVVATFGQGGTMFVGLTSPSPTLLIMANPGFRQSSISGVASGVAFPEPANADTLVGVTTPYSSEDENISAATFSNVLARWYGPFNTTAELLALRVTRDASNQPVSYEGMATASVAVSGSVASTGVLFDMVDPPEATLSGSITAPAETMGVSLRAFAASASSSVIVADRSVTPPGVFSFVLPASVGMTAGLTATTYGADGIGMRLAHGLAPDASGVLLDVPAAPRLVSPALASAGLAPGDTIDWEWSPEGAMYAVLLALRDDANGNALLVQAITTESEFTVPDLSSLGLEWTAGHQVFVRVFGLAVGRTTPEAAANYDWNRLVAIVAGTSAMSDVDGALGYDLNGWTFTSGP